MKMKKTFILGTLLTLILIPVFINFAAAEIDSSGNLRPGEYHIEPLRVDNGTTARIDASRSSNLIYFDLSDFWLRFEAEGGLSLIFLNQSEMAKFILGESYTYKHYEANTTKYEVYLTFQSLATELGFEPVVVEDLEKRNEDNPVYLEIIDAYIIVVNEQEGPLQFVMRYDHRNKFFPIIETVLANLLWMLFLGVGGKLFYEGNKMYKESEHQGRIMQGYGIGFLFGALGTLDWEIYRWYEEANPAEAWEGVFQFDIGTGSNILGTNLLTFVTFIGLGCSLLFISNTVERNVQTKKVPYFTYTLLAANFSFIAALYIPNITIYIFFVWVAILSVVGFNIMGVYIKLVRSTAGIVKKKALLTVVGVASVYFSLVFRNFVLPDFPINALASVFLIVSYYGIKLKL